MIRIHLPAWKSLLSSLLRRQRLALWVANPRGFTDTVKEGSLGDTKIRDDKVFEVFVWFIAENRVRRVPDRQKKQWGIRAD